MSAGLTDPIQFARLGDGIVIIRVCGRGTHQQSPGLRQVFEMTRGDTPAPRYVLDVDQCVTMDSTFMGTLASMAIHQRQRDGSSLVVLNVNEHVRNLLQTLGLNYVLELRAGNNAVDQADFKPSRPAPITRLEQILMMLEAHERLVDVDSRNEVKFEGVLRSLRESLEREQSHS